jgi:hypothetical protein
VSPPRQLSQGVNPAKFARTRPQTYSHSETRDQLARLLELAERPNVTIQVLRYAVGAHPAMAGSFTVLKFDEVPDIAFVEHQAGNLYLDDGDEAPYVRTYERLISVASSPADSAAFIRDVRASLP